MKKYLLACVLLAGVAVTTNAQTAFRGTSSNASNAITSSTSDTMSLSIGASYDVHGIQLTKATGTSVTATAILQGTNDGLGYVNIDTVTVASGALKSYSLKYVQPVWTRYRWIVTGGGSGSGTLKSTFVGRSYK